MFPVSAQVLAAFTGNYEATTEVWLLRTTPVLLPISAGEVRATYGSQVARTATLTISQELVDTYELSVLTDRVMIRVGVRDVISIPVFTGRLDTLDISEETGIVNVQCVDHGADVIRARFETPYVTTGTFTITTDMQLILKDVDSSFTASVDSNIIDSLDPKQMWEEDRGQALDELATSINSIWMADRSGGFTIFRNPYSFPTEPASVVTLRNGVGGTIIQFRGTRSRAEVVNSVTVVVERTNGATPVHVTVRDTDPGSTTYWGGAFGKQNVIIKNQSINNLSEAQNVASRILQQQLAATRTWNITTPAFPVIDPGDVITVVFDGNVTLQVVEQITYPLLARDGGTLTTREWQHIEGLP